MFCDEAARLRRYQGGNIRGRSRALGGAPPHIPQKGVGMSIERRIDDLIKAGWGVLESDFDPDAFQHWRQKAFECLNAMFGPDHIYTKYFEHFVQQGGRKNVLAAGGVLVAAKQQMACKEFGSPTPMGSAPSGRSYPSPSQPESF
jgi:hypothetical protein